MGKQRHQQSVARQGDQQIVQSSYEEDDNMLPSPEDLEKYNAIDPDFMSWIKNRCDVEQKARHDYNRSKIKFMQTTNRQFFTLDIISIVSSVIVVLAFMAYPIT